MDILLVLCCSPSLFLLFFFFFFCHRYLFSINLLLYILRFEIIWQLLIPLYNRLLLCDSYMSSFSQHLFLLFIWLSNLNFSCFEWLIKADIRNGTLWRHYNNLYALKWNFSIYDPSDISLQIVVWYLWT